MFGFFKNKNKDKVVTKDKVGDNSKDKKKDRANKEEKDAKATIRKGKEDKASKSIFRKSRSIELIKEANEEPSISAKKRRTLEAVALEGWQEDEDSPHRGNGTEGEDNTHSSNSGSSEEAHRPSSPASPSEHSHDGCANGEKRPASSKTASSSPSERGLQLKPGSDHKRHGQNSIGFLVSAATKQCTSVLTGAVGCSQLPHDGGGEKVMNRARLPGTESIRLPGNAAPLVMKPPLNPRVVAPRGPLASLPSTASGLTNVLSAEDERDESRHTPSPGVVTPPSSPGLPYGQAVPPYPVITGPSSRPTSPDGQASMLSTPSSSTSSLSSLTARPISPSGRRTPPGPRMGTGGKLTSSPTTGRKTVRTNIKTNPTVVSRRAGSRSPVNTCPSPVNPCPSPSPSTTTADVVIPSIDGERLKTPPSSPIPTRRLGDPSETSVSSPPPPPPQQQPNVVATPGVFPHTSVPDTTTTQPVPVVTTTPAAVPAVKPRLSSPSPPPKSSLPCEVKAEPVNKLTPRSVSPTAGKSRHSVASMHSLESIPENDSDGQTSANDTLEKNCKMKAILGSKASDPLQKPTENKSSTNHGLTSSSARLTAPEASSNGGISHKRSSSLTPVNEERLSHTSQPKTEPRANPKAMEINDTSGATQHQDGPPSASREHHDGGPLEDSEKKGISHHKKEEDVRNDQRLHMMGNAVVATEEIPAERMNRVQSRTSVSGHDAFSQPPVKSCASSVQEMVYGGDSGKAVSGSPLRKEPISSTQTTGKEAGMKKMDVGRERDNVKETKDVRRNKTIDSSHNQFSTLSSEDGETSGTPTHVVLRIPLRYSPLPNGKDVERRVSAEILLGRGGNGSADKERERRMERPRSVSSSREMGRERNSSDLLTRRRLASEGAETNGEMKDKVRGKVCRRSSSSSSQRHRPSVADQTSDETSSFAHENDDGKGSNDEVIVPWRKGTRSRSRVTKNPGRTKVIEDVEEPGQRNVNRNDSNFRSSLACHRTRSLSTGRGAVDVQERSAPGMDVPRSGERNNAPIRLRQSSRVTAPPRHRSKTRGTERRSTAETLSENMRVKDDLETSTDGEYESRRRAQSSSRALDTFRHSEEANATELSKTALDRDAGGARKPPRRRRSLSSNRRSSGSLRMERGDGVRLVARSRSDARDMAVTNAVVGRNKEVENVRRDPREFTRHESGYSQIKNGETNDSRNKSDIGSNRSNNSSDAAEAFKGATDCPVRLEQHSFPSEDANTVAANGDRSSLDHENKSRRISVQQHTPVVLTASQHCQTDDETNKIHTRSVQQQTPVVHTTSQHCQTDDEEANKNQTRSVQQQTPVVHTTSQHCQTDDEEANKNQTRSVQQQTPVVCTTSQHCQTDDEEANKKQTISAYQQTLEVPTNSQHCQTDDEENKTVTRSVQQQTLEVPTSSQHCQTDDEEQNKILTRSVQQQTLEVPTTSQHCQTDDDDEAARILQDTKDQASKELAAQEERYQKQVDQLTISLAEKQEEVSKLTQTLETLKGAQEALTNSEELQETLALLQQDVRDRAAQADSLRTELQYSKNEVELTKTKLKKLEEDLDAARQKNVALQNQITATANCNKTEELEAKIKTLEETLKTTEEERDKLSKTMEEIEAEREEEIKIIQDALDEAAQEREELIATFEKELQNMNTRNSNREQQLMEDFEWKLREMEKDHKKKLDERDRKAENTLHRAKRQAEEAEAEFRQKQEKMKNELNAEWEDKLRSECSRLKAELDDLHAEEKHLAVESMKVQKEQEIRALKQSWELRQEEMTKEISTLKDSLTDKDAYYHKELENMRTNADRDVWELRRKLQRLDEKNWTQQEYLQEKHHEEMERMRADYKERVADLEANLAVAMQNSDEDSRAQMEKTHNDEMEHLCEQHRLSMERLREELEAEKYQAVEEARVIVSKHLEYVNSSLREQLAEAVSNSTQYREELEAVRSALALREEVISTHEEELARLKGTDGAAASSDMASQSSLASSSDSGSSHSSSNSQDRLSLSESLGASVESQDDAHKSGGGSLLGKVFGGGWFSSSKTKETSRRGSAPAKQSS